MQEVRLCNGCEWLEQGYCSLYRKCTTDNNRLKECIEDYGIESLP